MASLQHSRIDLKLLPYFLAVAETASFSAAAKKLGLKGCSVSRGVAALEGQLGVQLFSRTTRRVSLTAEGKALHARVTPGLASLCEALDAVAQGDDKEPIGTVRLTASVDVASHDLPPCLATFSARHPGIRVDMTVTNRMVDLIAEGIDLALRASNGPLQDSSLVATRVARIPSHVFAAPSYLSRAGTPVTPGDAAEHRWVLHRGGSAGHPLPIRAESAHVVGDDLLFVREAVAAGLGLGLLPVPLVRDHVASGAMVRVLPQLTVRESGLFVVTPPARHVPRRVALFREHLLNHFKSDALGDL